MKQKLKKVERNKSERKKQAMITLQEMAVFNSLCGSLVALLILNIVIANLLFSFF